MIGSNISAACGLRRNLFPAQVEYCQIRPVNMTLVTSLDQVSDCLEKVTTPGFLQQDVIRIGIEKAQVL
jgi:hypothetical protein